MRKSPVRRRAAPSPDLPPDALPRRIERLSDAIRERRVIELLYGGAWRIVHPHAVGRMGTGRVGLLTWQTAGLARGPGQPGEGWRMFDVARIADARILRSSFTPRPRREDAPWTPGMPSPAADVPTRAAALAE